MIGCHFDIQPQNILVDKERFILADFGISKLDEDWTETRFRSTSSDYNAPECETIMEDQAVENMVGQSSDIWSFGCTIAETLTFMIHGPRGVVEFEERRKKTLHGYFTVFQFHHGSAACPSVSAWLQELAQLAHSEPMKKTLQLVNRMMAINPAERPKAKEVTAYLFEIVQSALTEEDRPVTPAFAVSSTTEVSSPSNYPIYPSQVEYVC
jgi:serine/threonine protein kinase